MNEVPVDPFGTSKPAPAPMPSDPKNRRFGIVLGTILGLVLQLGGYLLIRGRQDSFGTAMFIAVPFVSGFAVAAVVRRPDRSAACLAAAGLLSLSILLFTGWEGVVCCAMAFPICLAGMIIGAAVGYLVRGRFIDRMAAPQKTTLLIVLLSPLFLAAVDRFEQPYRSTQQREDFTSDVYVAASPQRVWEVLGQMEHLDGPRPFLLRLGLPVPTHCTLDHQAVGGRRVCYFENGIIEQEVTDWHPGSLMKLRIARNTLPGRHWLTFLDASYELIPEGTGTRLVRHTSIGTRLYPRWYWRPLERWGVSSEHDFVLANVQRHAQARP